LTPKKANKQRKLARTPVYSNNARHPSAKMRAGGTILPWSLDPSAVGKSKQGSFIETKQIED
jgi:hypothetical protein